jgi:hypothetical protein
MVSTDEIIPRDPVTGEIDFASDDQRKRYERARKTPVTVTVSGPVGCGKSAVAMLIEDALAANGVPVTFTSVRFGRETLEETEPRVELIERVDYPAPRSFFSERYKKYAAWPVVLWCRLRGHSSQPRWGATNRCLRCGDAR